MAELLALLGSHRRAKLGITLGVAAAVALAAVVSWQRLQAGNRAQLCKQAASKMADAWSPARQAKVRDAIEKAAGRAGWQRFAATLDGYAQRWSDMHGQACEATHVRGEQSEALLDLRLDCLDQRYQDVRALVDVISTQPASADKAMAAAVGLPSLQGCADVTGLRRVPGSGLEPARLAPLRARLARARTEVLIDSCNGALDDARAARSEAHTLGAVREEGSAYYRQAQALACLGNNQSAQDSFLEGAVLAARAQDDVGVAHAYIGLMQNSVSLQKLDGAKHWEELGAESVERVAGDLELRVDYAVSACMVDYYSDRAAQAEKNCRAALTLYGKLSTPHAYAEANAYQLLAILDSDRGDFAASSELLQKAQQLFAAALGPESNDAIRVLESVASNELEQDHLQAAVALQKRVVDATGSSGWTGNSVEALLFYGRLLVEAGRPAEAIPQFLRARALLDKIENPMQMLVSNSRRGVGAAYLAMGRPAQALPYLQEAWKLLPDDSDPYERSLLSIEYARALWEVTPERARALAIAREGRDALRKIEIGAWRKRKVAELDAWIAARERSH
jgi:tetratricopeptide (TPR) repeat protein